MSYLVKGEDGRPLLRKGKEIKAMDYVGVVKGVDVEKRLLTIVGSDETIDRVGEFIVVKGWMLENYLKNPVFLWAHNYASVPLGSAIKVTKSRDPNSLKFTIKFPTVGLHPFADMIFSLYQEKIINASSVGFIPWEWEEMSEEERNSLAPGVQYWGGHRFTKQELLELSGCAVPSNPSALQNALKSFGTELKGDPDRIMRFMMNGPVQGSDEGMERLFNLKIEDITNELSGEAVFVDETETKAHPVSDYLDEVVKAEEVLKPYPNEHACRLADPADFSEFRRKKRKHNDKEYSVIFGKKEDGDAWAEQAYRYNKEVWSESEAKSHCGDHNGSFEPASEAMSENLTVKIHPTLLDLLTEQFKEDEDELKEVTVVLVKEEDGLTVESVSVKDEDEPVPGTPEFLWISLLDSFDVLPNDLTDWKEGEHSIVKFTREESGFKAELIEGYELPRLPKTFSEQYPEKLRQIKSLLEEVIADVKEVSERSEQPPEGQSRVVDEVGHNPEVKINPETLDQLVQSIQKLHHVLRG